MVNEADQRLFHNIRYNPHHVLHELLPPISVASQNYELRTRAHNREIPCRAWILTLYHSDDVQWLLLIDSLVSSTIIIIIILMYSIYAYFMYYCVLSILHLKNKLNWTLISIVCADIHTILFAPNPCSRNVCIRILSTGYIVTCDHCDLSHCDCINKMLIITKY